jgi:AcrR family transcriptional regulator
VCILSQCEAARRPEAARWRHLKERADRVVAGGELPGLRERKKTRTRAAIKHQALQLFRERGYEATTVREIAAAAEVSESTFFRYFPTKEAVVFWDVYDPLIIEAVRAQPTRAGPIAAIRGALQDVLGRLSAAERAELLDRIALMLSIPPLRAVAANQPGGQAAVRLLTSVLAERTGRTPGDFAVRSLVGAVLGVCFAAAFAAVEDPEADVVLLLDQAMAHLEAGLPT